MASEAEVAAMRRAVQLSTRGLATTHPNPVVGCVVLAADGATTVGEGWHERAGGPHAEVAALAAAGARAQGGTVVVTLEPCRHQGRTPPCTETILRAGAARVVFAVRDPDPAAAGGAEALRGSGVDVEVGVLAGEAAAVNERWLAAVRRGRPHVTWKYAASLDGRVAAADGTSKWITSPEARADAHRLRAESDAIVVGVGTVLADNPRLTVRRPAAARSPTDRPAPAEPSAPAGPGASGEQAAGGKRHARGVEPWTDADPPGLDVSTGPAPLRVVVDSHGRTPAGARVLDDAAPTLLAVGPHATPPAGVDTVVLPPADGGLDLTALLVALFARDRRSVLVEGGPRLAGSFVDAGLVDRVVGYVAPLLVGGPPAYPTLGGRGAAGIGVAVRLRLDDVCRVGTDLRLSARLDRATL